MRFLFLKRIFGIDEKKLDIQRGLNALYNMNSSIVLIGGISDCLPTVFRFFCEFSAVLPIMHGFFLLEHLRSEIRIVDMK